MYPEQIGIPKDQLEITKDYGTNPLDIVARNIIKNEHNVN